MMKLILILGALALAQLAFAGVATPDEKKPEAAKDVVKKKSTEVSFDDLLVQGKYHFSDESVTTVEQDKVLDALLGVRTEFKDRIKKSATRF